MKTVITALNYPKLNIALQKEKNLKIMHKDIIYKEGILEILEIKKEIDFLIINYDLPGKISIEELIKKIKKMNNKIELIFILEKENEEKEKILKKYEIKNIYYNDQMEIENFIQMLQEKNKKNEKELEEEIRKLKKIIQEKDKSEQKIQNKKEERRRKSILKKREKR